MSDQDPAVRAWGESMAASADQAASTSALLRRLTGELDQLRVDYNASLLELTDAHADVERVIGQRNAAVNRWADVRIEVENLRTELAESRNWIVARDGGRTCERCEGEVRRGEAYEVQDSTDGLLLHIECPRPTPHLDAVKRERDEALAENERLKARIARQRGTYQLTDKGLAALAGPEPTEGEPPA